MKFFVEYIKSLFPNASDDRLLTVLVTLGIFFAGFIIRGVINYFSGEIKKKQIRNDLRSIIHEISDNLAKQIDHINLFTKTTNVDTPIWSMEYVHIPIERLEEYGYRGCSNAFITSRHFWSAKKARASINELYKHIDLVRNVINEYRIFFEKINDKYLMHQKRFNELNDLQGKHFDDLASAINIASRNRGLDESEELFAKEIQKVLDARNDWLLLEDRFVPSVIHEQLINKTFEMFRGKRLEELMLREAVKALRDSKYEFESMEHVTNHLLEGLTSYCESYKMAYSSMTRSYLVMTKY